MTEPVSLDDIFAVADLIERANNDHDGDFTITHNYDHWYVELGHLHIPTTPPNPDSLYCNPITKWSKGSTLNEAIRNCLAGIPGA